MTPKGLFVNDNSHRGDGERRLLRDVQLKGYDLEQDPHKWVKAQFVVSNVSAQDVKNLRVVCEFYDPQAHYLDSEQWLLAGVVPVGKTMENNSLKRKFIHTRATDFRCSITGCMSRVGPRTQATTEQWKSMPPRIKGMLRERVMNTIKGCRPTCRVHMPWV